jgi:molecular chaperone GrpE (heat shock protein)
MALSLFRSRILSRYGIHSGVVNRVASPVQAARYTASQAQPKSDLKEEEIPKAEEVSAPEEADSLFTKKCAELKSAEAQVKGLHHKLLLKYADAENKRRERVSEIKRRSEKRVAEFGQKIVSIQESLSKVCNIAQARSDAADSSDKVKSLAEGLVMTRGILKNVLEKHNISVPKPSEK